MNESNEQDIAGMSTTAPHPEGCVCFKQYLRPDGRQRHVYASRDGAVSVQVARLRSLAGVTFEVEVLRTGEVSLTAEKYDEEDELIPVAHEIVANEEGAVLSAIDRLVGHAADLIGVAS